MLTEVMSLMVRAKRMRQADLLARLDRFDREGILMTVHQLMIARLLREENGVLELTERAVNYYGCHG